MTELVAADIGGTHARFALATVADGKVVRLGEPVTLNTNDHVSLQSAWTAFGERSAQPLPRAVAISFAGPVHGDVLKLTNNPWVVRPAQLPAELGVDTLTLINDFAAVGHAVATMGPEQYRHVCGPDVALPQFGTISIVGPGTGLGVAHVFRHANGYHVSGTEGGHADFAALDPLEDRIVADLRGRYRRVSAERMISGPGLANIYDVLRRIEGHGHSFEETELWTAALDGSDSLAVAALDRFCLCLGAFAGDIALAQGGAGVVIAGGLGLRIVDRLNASGFALRFTAKGRFQAYMAAIPVKIVIHEEPGLLGAAAAFAREHA